MIKKYNEFVNEGMISRLWNELDGTEERKEERVVMNGVDNHHSFTDNNKVFHKDGYKVIGQSPFVLQRLVKRLIELRGNECDLNDVDVSDMAIFTELFKNSNFNGDISGWDVKKGQVFAFMFFNCPFNKDISKWEVYNVRNFESMFSGYKTFDRTNINISGWTLRCVEKMVNMFHNTIINEDFHNWNPNRVVKKTGMFLRCENENKYGIPKWYHGAK